MIEVVGHTAVDHICKVSHLPAPNASASVLDRKIFYGGGAANIAAGIATLGGKVALISAVGGDFAGSEYDKWLDKLHIEKRFFVVPEANTATAFMFTDPQGDQMTFFEWGASRAFESEPAPSLDFVHMATADPTFNLRVSEHAKFCSFDPGQDLHLYPPENLSKIIDNIDILIANQHEYEGICKKLQISFEDITSRVPLVIETKGSAGSLLIQNEEMFNIPAIPVQFQDPTGAGDGFRAGFLTAYTKGYDPLTSVKVGTVTASYIVEHIGCQTSLANWNQMLERYNKYFGSLPKPRNPLTN